LGIEVSYAAGHQAETWEAAIKPNTKLLIWEAITNPLVRVADGEALAGLARDRGLVSLVDATFATPINQRPLEFGVDLVMHSATKYLGGHTDLIGGVLAGGDELIDQATQKLASFGGSADPHAVFLLERGIKTLALRMARHNENGRAVSDYLASHPRVERVFYPTLDDHPDRDVAARVLNGAGGVVAFIPRATPDEAQRIVERFEWIRLAPSLGGVESLVSMPAMTSHRHFTSDQRAQRGMPDQTVRLALGVEAAADLIDDLDRALAS
jgi:cystathionine beta-lyase/cystathionine gamma-synthase